MPQLPLFFLRPRRLARQFLAKAIAQALNTRTRVPTEGAPSYEPPRGDSEASRRNFPIMTPRPHDSGHYALLSGHSGRIGRIAQYLSKKRMTLFVYAVARHLAYQPDDTDLGRRPLPYDASKDFSSQSPRQAFRAWGSTFRSGSTFVEFRASSLTWSIGTITNTIVP